MREHDVTALTSAELEAARRELAASMARPGPVSGPPGDPSPHGRYRRRAGRTGRRPPWGYSAPLIGGCELREPGKRGMFLKPSLRADDHSEISQLVAPRSSLYWR